VREQVIFSVIILFLNRHYRHHAVTVTY